MCNIIVSISMCNIIVSISMKFGVLNFEYAFQLCVKYWF